MEHRVVTMERGTTDEGRQGYAARCETCGAITFGGAESRTAARRALEGAHTARRAASAVEDRLHCR